MNFEFNEGIWKIILLVAGAILAYGAKFISNKLVEEEKRQKAIIILKIIGFIMVACAGAAVMFFD